MTADFDVHESGQLRLTTAGEQTSLLPIPDEKIALSDGPALASEAIRPKRSQIVETTLDRVPCGVIFWQAWDGVVKGHQEYAPRSTYWKLDNDDLYDVRELREFGRSWKFSDCGLEPTSPVRTMFQPIAARFGEAARRAMMAHV